MRENNHLVIMAGGAGERFWPVSSTQKPKQFLDILGCGKTLLQLTFDRFEELFPINNVWVMTSLKYKELVKEQLPQLPISNIICEPERRNTAPCIAYISWKIKKINNQANIVVTPADHYIADIEQFQLAIKKAMHFTAETDAIVTLGVKPTRPETGYGYIEADLGNSSLRNQHIYRVNSFKEKPNEDIALQYIAKNNFFWNSGIFIWRVQTIVNAFRVYQTDIAKIFESVMPYLNTEQEECVISTEFVKCPNISIDYAIMEKAEEIFIHPVSFGWCDLGTWNSLRTQVNKDSYGNALIGKDIKLFEATENIIYNSSLKQIVVQGLEGYVVAEKDGVLLICKLSEEQRIKLFH